MLKYKNLLGRVTYDDEAKILHGEVIGINDVITFQAKDADTIEAEFKASVDDYLAFCEEEGKEPEKSVSGETRIRMGEERHLLVSKISQAKNVSMNDWLNEAIDEKIKKEVG
ncbi:MAG: type II toxin-antitoxin system HicB family antitoxin [Bdellovibrionales bacterium]|nr:type II toxin-antitoxin system HicB family antitoxin [Bdellovibrionales bacterium]